MKFDDLIIRKIFEVVATKCQILRLKIQIQFWPRLRPRYRWRSLQNSAPLDLLTEFNGHTSKGLEEKRWEMGMLWRRGSEGRGWDPQGLVHTPMSEILKNTPIAELI